MTAPPCFHRRAMAKGCKVRPDNTILTGWACYDCSKEILYVITVEDLKHVGNPIFEARHFLEACEKMDYDKAVTDLSQKLSVPDLSQNEKGTSYGRGKKIGDFGGEGIGQSLGE